MVKLKAFETQIQVDNTALKEYDGDDEEEPHRESTVMKYIEAVGGKQFSIHVTVGHNFDFDQADVVAWDIYIDGKCVGSPVIPEMQWLNNGRAAHSTRTGVRSYSGQSSVEQSFQFDQIGFRELEEGETPETVKKQYDGLGEIKILVKRMKSESVQLAKPDGRSALEADPKKVPEKAVKGQAISLSSSLGPAKDIEPWYVCHGEPCDETPVATFIFKYRSRKDLQDLLLIPKTPEPVALEDRPVSELNGEEMRLLIERQRAKLAATQPRVKIEAEVRMKRERQEEWESGMEKRRRPGAGETLNLNDGDEDEVQFFSTAVVNNGMPRKELETIDLLD